MAVLTPDQICHCCLKEREENGLPPQALEVLPTRITNSRFFKRKSIPLKVCLKCDGDAYPAIKKTHKF